MDEISNSINLYRTSLHGFAVDALWGTGALIIGLFLAMVVRSLTRSLIGKVPIHRLGLLARYIPPQQVRIFAGWLGQAAFWVILIFSVFVAFEILGIKLLTRWLNELSDYLPNVFGAFAVLAVGTLVARAIRNIIVRSGKTAGFDNADIVGFVAYVSMITVAILVAVKQLGIEIEFLMSTILVVLGTLLFGGALSFGIGSAPLVTHILAVYYARRTIQIGSKITLGEYTGTVVEITPTSIVLDQQGSKVLVPGKLLHDSVRTITSS